MERVYHEGDHMGTRLRRSKYTAHGGTEPTYRPLTGELPFQIDPGRTAAVGPHKTKAASRTKTARIANYELHTKLRKPAGGYHETRPVAENRN